MSTKEDVLFELPRRIRDDVSVLSRDVVGFPTLLHISTNPNIKVFESRVPSNTLLNEDRSQPRICVSRSVMDAISSYYRFSHELNEQTKPAKYTIYGFEYNFAIKPNDKLVMNPEEELWLVEYDYATSEYLPTIMGSFTITSTTNSLIKNRYKYTGYLQLEKECKLSNVDDVYTLQPGNYIFQFETTLVPCENTVGKSLFKHVDTKVLKVYRVGTDIKPEDRDINIQTAESLFHDSLKPKSTIRYHNTLIW